MCKLCALKLTRAFEFYQRCLRLNFAAKLELPTSIQNRPIRIKPHSNIIENTNIIRQKIQFRCKTCRQLFSTTDDLILHRQRIHLKPKVILSCPQCSAKFHSKPSFTLHCKLHNDNICTFCNMGFASELQITKHIIQSHPESVGRRYLCVKCQNVYQTRKMMLRHRRLVHKDTSVVYRCGLCQILESRGRLELRNHVLECEGNLNAIGDVNDQDDGMPVEFLNYNLLTDEDYFEAKNLLLGNDETHPMGMVEEFLDESFQISSYDPSMLNLLMDDIGVDKAVQKSEPFLKHCYKCPRCQDSPLMNSQLELNQHLAHAHNEPVLVCNECGENFNKTEDLLIHRSQHKYENRMANQSLSTFFGSTTNPLVNEQFTRISDSSGNTKFSCKLCSRSYKTTSNMLRHQCPAIPSTHQSLKCPECCSILTTPQALVAHRQTHIADPLWCSLCDKKFTTIAGLKYHLKTHTGIRTISCPFCQRKFMANGNLQAHIRTVHSVVRPHGCGECEQSFASGYHLRRHISSVHRKERDFVCGVCGKRFGQQSHLNHHSWQHTGIKPFPCERCDLSYTSVTALKKHIRNVHSGTLVSIKQND